MKNESAGLPAEPGQHKWLTAASIGLVACISADMVHEAAGHGIASWLAGDRILSLSTVALQNETPNRFVSAAGTSANCVVGWLALLLFRRARGGTPLACFLWLFGMFNLFNAGYLVVSALLNSGDWANVVAGLSPFWFWRCLLAFAGAAVYFVSLRWAANLLARLMGPRDARRLILPAYIAGGAVMTLASVFNPISSDLIMMSGVGASFGLNFGLFFVPAMVGCRAGEGASKSGALSFSFFWLALALALSAVFVAVLGPGIRFHQ